MAFVVSVKVDKIRLSLVISYHTFWLGFRVSWFQSCSLLTRRYNLIGVGVAHIFDNPLKWKRDLLYFEKPSLHQMNSDIFDHLICVLFRCFLDHLKIFMKLFTFGDKLFNTLQSDSSFLAWKAKLGIHFELWFVLISQPIVLSNQIFNVFIYWPLVNDHIVTLLKQLKLPFFNDFVKLLESAFDLLL